MKRVFDDAFKLMAVELSQAKGFVIATARELDMDPSRLSKWRNDPRYNGGHILMDKPGLSEEQQRIRRLEKELKEARLERDILKKTVSIFSREAGTLPVHKEPQQNLFR